MVCRLGVLTAERVNMREAVVYHRHDVPERCDLGVKTAALAALGEMAALREEGVAEPLVLACRGVKEGESTLKRFFAFSFWFSLEWSWM